jgi:hypothetical protein
MSGEGAEMVPETSVIFNRVMILRYIILAINSSLNTPRTHAALLRHYWVPRTVNSTAFIAWREESSITETCISGILHSRLAGLHKGRLLTKEFITTVPVMVRIREYKLLHWTEWCLVFGMGFPSLQNLTYFMELIVSWKANVAYTVQYK